MEGTTETWPEGKQSEELETKIKKCVEVQALTTSARVPGVG
jgi:hypothetical protein